MHDDSDSDAEDSTEGRYEEITDYGPAGTRKDDRSRKHRRERSTSRTRHSDRKHRREEKPVEHNEDEKNTKITDEEKVQYGLTINKKSDKGLRDEKRDARPRRDDDRSDGEREKRESTSRGPKTADEEALDALLGDEPNKRNFDPDSTADEYRAVPIEEFGTSLLKNLGWDGRMKGKAAEPRKHGNLTGLGSKNAKEAEDLGAWEQKKPKSRRLDDYQREEDARRRRRDERHGETSYKRERERERERDRERHRERR